MHDGDLCFVVADILTELFAMHALRGTIFEKAVSTTSFVQTTGLLPCVSCDDG